MNIDSSRPAITTALTHGVCRFLTERAFTPLREFKLATKRRADVAGIDAEGRFTLVEIKSSTADFRADNKWHDYLAHGDFFYFAVDASFPLELLPADHGILIADRYSATLYREASETPMNGNRRRHQLLRFARQAGGRLERFVDPGV